MENLVFFAENGVTSTSANHSADLAKEYIQSIETKLSNIGFYSSDVSLIGSAERTKVKEGWHDNQIAEIPELLQKIIKAKSLIAWLREAIKAKDKMYEEIKNLSVDEYAEKLGVDLPNEPRRRKTITKEELIDQMTVKERNRYFSLETRAAVIGKFIHPKGTYSEARKDFLTKLSNEHKVEGDGRDTLIYTYTPSAEIGLIEDVFFKLQKEHRETQAELNGILHTIEEKINADDIQVENEYMAAYKDYRAKYQEVASQFVIFKNEKQAELSKKKIVIPNDLKAIYDEINSLAKK